MNFMLRVQQHPLYFFLFFIVSIQSLWAHESSKTVEKANLTISTDKNGFRCPKKSLQNCVIQVSQPLCLPSAGSVFITNNSNIAAFNIQAFSADSAFSLFVLQNNGCPAALLPGRSCIISFFTNASVSFFLSGVMVKGTNTNPTFFDMQAIPCPPAVISVTPTTLIFAENSTANVTVTNLPGSLFPAINVSALIPAGSNISVQSTTCGASLPIGASCTITFASSVQEGPTIIPIAGTNTNAVNVAVTVTSQPIISITNPVQQNRVVTVGSAIPLSLEITNDVSSPVNANGITVTNQAGCPNLVVDDSNCTSVAPGASCLLDLTSPTPYAPCTITVSGTNTANSPQALIAFFHLGGLVFEESAGVGKIVIDAAQTFTSQWTSVFTNIVGATSLIDGFNNTNAIVVDAACTGDPANCAAQRCRDISADWFLPARDELISVRNVLCANSVIPCDFGGFLPVLYWSSSQDILLSAWFVDFPAGTSINTAVKTSNFEVRCIRVFP
jgi:hypothetical protein